jgi:hypothetical protein
MNIIKSIVQLSIGVALGVGMVLSCSNDSPHRSDAATCDCPVSEAPIVGRAAVVEGTPQTLQPGEQSSANVACLPGMQFLSGTCTTRDPTDVKDITIQQFGFDNGRMIWYCAYKNNGLTAVEVKASALCLKPPA